MELQIWNVQDFKTLAGVKLKNLLSNIVLPKFQRPEIIEHSNDILKIKNSY